MGDWWGLVWFGRITTIGWVIVCVHARHSHAVVAVIVVVEVVVQKIKRQTVTLKPYQFGDPPLRESG